MPGAALLHRLRARGLGQLSSQLRHMMRADVAGVQAGVRYMRDRKPVNVAAFAQLHNLCMTLLSLWMTVETVTQARALPVCAGRMCEAPESSGPA